MEMNRREKAEMLADRPYLIKITSDETTDGRPAFVAQVAELPGCFGSGSTQQEALEDVRLALVDFIESLLDDNMSVPDPLPISQSGGGRLRPIRQDVVASVTSLEQETVEPKYVQTVIA